MQYSSEPPEQQDSQGYSHDSVRDQRMPGWFWIDNEIVDQYAARMKPMALACYVYLCRRANHQGRSWASQRTMSDALGVDRGTVRSAIKQLVELGLLHVQIRRNEDGSHASTVYTLLAVEKTPRASNTGEGGGSIAQGGSTAQGGSISPEEDTEKEDPEKDSIPVGQNSVANAPSVCAKTAPPQPGEGAEPVYPGDDSDLNKRKAYFVAYLHTRLSERGLLEEKPLTETDRKRFVGEIGKYLKTGARRGRVLLALDRIVARWPEKKLSFSQAWDDTQPGGSTGGKLSVARVNGRDERERPQGRSKIWIGDDDV